MTAIDLFAGVGGWTLGARRAGVRVLWAANHARAAVLWHAANHPETLHACQDLQQADFTQAPAHDLLLASPACQGHSDARGKDQGPKHDADRATAWAVITCAEVHQPAAILVENVWQFRRWKLFPVWRAGLEALGYGVSETILDAADFGVPQHRRRLFVLALRGRAGKAVPQLPDPGRAHVPARSFLDLDAGFRLRGDDCDATPWSPIAGHCPKTLARVANGRARFGDVFLAPYYKSGSGLTGRSIDRPIGVVTTLDRWAVVRGDEMRMLNVAEYRAAMGFPETTALPAHRALAIHLLGNAVCPPQAADLVRFVQEVA